MAVPLLAVAKNPIEQIRKAAMRSTLNQPGTKPFHLQASIVPSKPNGSAAQTGQIEIWWTSPSQFRRDVRCRSFHQIEIANNGKIFQTNEGDYFPEWLREISVALINPIPDIDQTMKDADGGEIKHLLGNTYFSWMLMSSNGTIEKGMGASVAITDNTGLLFYVGGLGWGGLFKDYRNFHGRNVPRVVQGGNPEVTATINKLEDLPSLPADFFSADKPDSSDPLTVVVVDEKLIRANLQDAPKATWPALKDGPLEGAFTTMITIDRAGKVREVGHIIGDNSNLAEAARNLILSYKFAPYLQEGVPVQVISRITMSFKTTRPVS